MQIQVLRQNRYKAALLAVCAACAGSFISIRLRGFFSLARGVDLPVWFLYVFTAAAALLSLIFYKHLKEFLRKYAFTGKPISYVILVLSIAFCFVLRDILLARPLQGSDISAGRLASAASLVGAGLLMAVFLSLILLAVRKSLSKIREYLKMLTVRDAAVAAALLIILNFFAWLYIKSSHTIYFWDNAGYWSISHQLAETAQQGLGPFISKVYESVLTTDYNDLIILPWVPLVLIFGPSRWVFVAGIVNLSLFPVLLLLYAHIRTSCSRPVLTFACTAISVPMLFYTAIVGFVDISGVFFALAALLLLLRDKGQSSPVRYFAIGCLLAFAILLRRWYAFFALSFFIALAVDGVFFRKSASPFFSALLAFGFSLLFLFQPFVSGQLLKNYGSMYSAYALGLGTDIRYLFFYFGIFVLLLAFCGGFYLLTQRETRRRGVFLLIQSVVCFFLFTKVQSHGQQHLLLYVPVLLCLLTATYGQLAERINKQKATAVIMAAAALAAFINPLFVKERPNKITDIKTFTVFPSFNYEPPRREDADEIVRLVRYLDSAVGADGKTVGVLASSFALNLDILLNAEASLGYPRITDIKRDYFEWLPEIDSRDALPGGLFQADYLLVADPVQLHLSREKQQSIALPAEEVLTGTGFGAAFRPIGETFHIGYDGSITVRLYEKIREITEAEKKTLLDAAAAAKSGK